MPYFPQGMRRVREIQLIMKANTVRAERIEKLGRDKGHPQRTANMILFLIFEEV